MADSPRILVYEEPHTTMSSLGGAEAGFLLPIYPGMGVLQARNTNEHRLKEHLQEKTCSLAKGLGKGQFS